MRRSLRSLQRENPEVPEDAEIFRSLEQAIRETQRLLQDAQEMAESFERGQAKLLDLAALGLMVEIVAHELNRATDHALRALKTAERDASSPLRARLSTLESQLQTLHKRLRILDPLAQPARQVKETFDVVDVLREIVAAHEAQFERHQIKCSIRGPQNSPSFKVKMVRGMIVQIIENVLSNSVYWMAQEQVEDPSFQGQIEIDVDVEKRAISITDNGPGVPAARAKEVFHAFFTTKPPGQGKGLGLYISQEIAKYHDASLEFVDEGRVHPSKLNTIRLTLARAGA
jgi:signal transduction histidine kinase